MDLIGRLAGWGLARPSLLPVAVPGATRQRLALERLAREWGWPLAASPADADILVHCGEVTGELAEAAALVWSQVPEPRARVELRDGVDVAVALREGRNKLLDRARRRDHVEHGIGMVAGLSLAGRAPDRDGLQLDRLSVPLGPILPEWPAGLRLRMVLQGDVVQAAVAEVVGSHRAAAMPFWDEPWRRRRTGEPVTVDAASRHRAAAHLDSLARLLAVAGMDGDAWRCRRLRDRLLDASSPAAAA
ncbi:MAG TPA: hypothetical protein VE776_12960, partial [Actinomycetota bacterium]|nr:hypothetical protein [Actinomycetota bacterium]